MKNPNAIISSNFGPIIINVNDSVIGRFISRDGYWAIDDIKLIQNLLEFLFQKNERLTFYDVGSNIGTHSLAISKTFGQKIKIRAFEAQRQVFNMMCGTVAINGLNNVYCHNVAVSNFMDQQLNIDLPDYSSINNFGGLELLPPLVTDNQTMKKQSKEIVYTVTLDSFLEHVDFLKIDVEGMEDKVLQGAVNIIDKCRPICFVEMKKTNVDFVFNFYKNRNYLAFKKNDDVIFIPIEHQIEIDGLEKLL